MCEQLQLSLCGSYTTYNVKWVKTANQEQRLFIRDTV
jgi:hypothetical protein